MKPSQTCPSCGADLTLDAANGHCLRCLWQLALVPDDPLPIPAGDKPFFEQPGDKIGRYKLLQQIGEGGCGVVYLAEQTEPVRRNVALKVIKLGMDTKSVIARFEAERQAMALMDHLNIAKVLDAGATNSGRPFFVMELVRGIKITEFCDQNNLSTPDRLRLFVQVCNAIQHAHQKGVIHRDIKPSNILVTLNDDVPVPKVIDFGIAKATQHRLTDKTLFTAFEQFIGTPAYMSPEQADMNAAGIDTRSDIYSLGVLLYELLTGQTPFEGKSVNGAGIDEIRRLIREREPARPSTRLSTMMDEELMTTANHRRIDAPKLIHLVRGDLDWIVMKALEKDRARRYETANGLAMDVERHLQHEPVIARPPGNLYRFQKMVRRNTLAFAAAAAVAAALVIGLGFSTWQYIQKSRAERDQARLRGAAEKAQADEAQLRQHAELQELASRKRAYAADMNLLQKALAEDNLPRAQELLDRQRPASGEQDLRGWEWRYFWQFCQSDAAFTLSRRSNSVVSVSFSSDGALLAVGTWQGEVTIWDVAKRQMIFQHDNDCHCPRRVAFAPTGELLAYYEREPDTRKNIVLWNGLTRAEVRRLPVRESVRDLAFTRDGTLFTAEFGASNNVTRWDVVNGQVLERFTAAVPMHLSGNVFNVAGDGIRFAQAINGKNNWVRVIDRKDGAGPLFKAGDELTSALAFSPDGQSLLTGTGYSEGTITTWDFHAQKSTGSLSGHHGWISSLKFLPGGRIVASSSADGTIRLWDFPTQRLIRTLRGHHGELWSLDVSPDGRWLASGSEDGSVVFWDLTSSTNRPPAYRSWPTTFKASDWEYSPDGRFFAVVADGHLRLYDPVTFKVLSEPALTLTNVNGFAFSPDMRLLVGVDTHGYMSVWDVPRQRSVTNFAAYAFPAYIWGPGFLPGGKSLLTFDQQQIVKEWDTATWREMRHWQIKSNWDMQAFCPSAGLGAMGSIDSGSIDLINIHQPERDLDLQGEKRMNSLIFSPDGKTLIAVDARGGLEFWNTRTGARTALLQTAGLGSHSAAISSDGQRLAASGDGQQAVKLWDFTSREELNNLPGKGSYFRHVVFSPDGNTIGSCNQTGEFHFWAAPSWEQIAATEKSRAISPP